MKLYSGRPKHIRSKENKIIQGIPSLSVRKLAAEVGFRRVSTRRILKVHLRLKPYKIQTSQQSRTRTMKEDYEQVKDTLLTSKLTHFEKNNRGISYTKRNLKIYLFLWFLFHVSTANIYWVITIYFWPFFFCVTLCVELYYNVVSIF